MPTPLSWLNGEFVPADAAAVGLGDGGLLHGIAVFTTMKAAAGRVVDLDAHLSRLRRSAAALHVPVAYAEADLAAAVTGLLARSGLADARLRVTLTRGEGATDPRAAGRFRPNAFATCVPLTPYPPEWYDRGITVMLNSETKLNPYDLKAGHKTNDYLSRFAALREAARRGAGEALWFDVHNYLQGGSVSNVFLLERLGEAEVLVTPPTNDDLKDPAVRAACPYPRSCVLPGTVRARVLDAAARAGLDVRREAVDVNRLLAARSVFLTNSTTGLLPVAHAEQHDFRIGGDTFRILADLAAG